MKSEKRHRTEGIELPRLIRTLGEKHLQIFGNNRSGHHQTCGEERKNKKEYLRRSKQLFEIKLHWRNFIKGINTWAESLVRYLGPYLKWTREELPQMDK